MERAEKVAIEQSENTLVELHDFQSFPMTLSVRGDRDDVVGHVYPHRAQNMRA